MFYWLTCRAAEAYGAPGNWVAGWIPLCGHILRFLTRLLMHHHFIWVVADKRCHSNICLILMKRYDAPVLIFIAACTERPSSTCFLPLVHARCAPHQLSSITTNVMGFFVTPETGQGLTGPRPCSGRRSLIGRLGWHGWWWHAWLNKLVLVDHLTTTQPSVLHEISDWTIISKDEKCLMSTVWSKSNLGILESHKNGDTAC